MRVIFLQAVLVLGLLGCSSSPATKISERFNLCAHLPAGSTYVLSAPGPDYDMGSLKLNGADIEVYAGYQPDFPKKVAETISQVSKEFKFADVEVVGETESVLLWRKQSPDSGPLLVVFKGKKLLATMPALKQRGFIADCD
jgi:hypothetical protein